MHRICLFLLTLGLVYVSQGQMQEPPPCVNSDYVCSLLASTEKSFDDGCKRMCTCALNPAGYYESQCPAMACDEEISKLFAKSRGSFNAHCRKINNAIRKMMRD